MIKNMGSLKNYNGPFFTFIITKKRKNKSYYRLPKCSKKKYHSAKNKAKDKLGMQWRKPHKDCEKICLKKK